MSAVLHRQTFTTSRLLEFFSEKELAMQIGHDKAMWPIVLVKELIDNALDACEEAGVAPKIRVSVEPDAVTVSDNGAGLPAAVIKHSLDYTVRVSNKAHYVSPTRGQLGNALKCLWAAPFVIDGERGLIEIEAGGVHHCIEVSLDLIAQQPQLDHQQRPVNVKNGTSITLHWPEIACLLNGPQSASFYKPPTLVQLLRDYALFNPHATFSLETLDGSWTCRPTAPAWLKWLPSRPTSPHWYSVERLRALIAAYLTTEQQTGESRTVRELVAEFDGLRGSAKQKRVTETAGLSGALLSELVRNGDIAADRVEALLCAMQQEARPVKPKTLGVLGEAHLEAQMQRTCFVDTVWTKKVEGEAEGLPFVVEAACGVYAEEYRGCPREMIVGLNWSPVFKIPIAELSQLLGECRIDSFDPVVFVLHIACPRFEFMERGKGAVVLPEALLDALNKCVRSVTKPWKTAKRQADRDDRVEARELERLHKQREQHLSIKAACFQIMEQAYLHASDNGRLPANARQIMYAARALALPLTDGKWVKNSATFTQQYLPDFLEAEPVLTQNWDVVFDARGKLIEPHTDHRVDLGTLAVRQYIAGWRNEAEGLDINLPRLYPTAGPSNRYCFALFVEKEGFEALLTSARIASRYDLAIMSTKGMSVTAARTLVERLSNEGVTVLVLRDFDKAGFSIVHTLRSDTRRYRFAQTPRVIDLGLRLKDAKAMRLQSEYVSYPGKEDPGHNLRENGATDEEIAFLVSGRDYGGQWIGERIELNAMTSRQFLTFLEDKLSAAGVQKIVPDRTTLAQAYRRALCLAKAQREIDHFIQSDDAERDLSIPDDLPDRVRELIDGTSQSWDSALMTLASDDEDAS